ncbi:MAG TPA: hypothetical protein VM261_28340 [Kofleriaceae bacterium]|nr:hypothetical protein [Kofleriaceae bacterium]
MSSRLSSLLVRDGLVGVKRMEKAYQRQVIYGGSLDTTLLEMGLVSEDRLTQYLALASVLPPATRAECNVFDAEAVKLCNEHDAIRHRVVPLSLEDGSLRLLVHDPVDMGLLEELADQLDVPVQPLIVPEYRWHMVFTRNYGGQTTARFSTLARAADASPITSPVGRARTVIVDGEEHQVVDVRSPIVRPVGPDHPTQKMNLPEPGVAGTGAVAGPPPATRTPTPRTLTAAANLAMERTGERRVTRQVPVAPPPARPGTVELEAEEAAPNEPAPPTITARSRTGEMSAQSVAQHYASVEAMRVQAVERRAATASIRDSGPISGPTSTSDGVPTRPLVSGNTPLSAPPVPDVPDDGSPLLVPTARALLSAATDRDKVFMILLRALRSKARWAGLLTVQGGAAIGRIALADHGLDISAMPSVLIPLDTTSPFQSTTHARHPYVGPVASGNTDIDVMIARMGGTVPPTALLLPILLRDRCIALAIAHRMNDAVTLAEVTELLPLAAATADALGRLIVRSKSVGYRVPTASDAAPNVEADDVATKKVQKKAAEWAVPTVPAAENPADVPAAIATAGSITVAATSRPIADVLDAVEADDDVKAEAAIADAVNRADEVVPLLPARFPGRLRVDRYQVSGRALRPGQYGGLLELVVRLGAPVGELLLEKMGDSRRDVRFYATVCTAAIRPRSAVYALVERLFDADYGVRGAAVEALTGYPLRDLDLAMVRCRHALHSEDLDRVAASSQAIAELADVAAIPDLIDVVGRESKRAELARRALVALTRSDFGTSERKWRKWWEEHKERHRIEWLIDALGQKDVALRGAAAEDLRRLTGEFFGFDPGQGRREREDAHKRWAQWWKETGRKRFTRDDDERVRPTAVLPVTTRRD